MRLRSVLRSGKSCRTKSRTSAGKTSKADVAIVELCLILGHLHGVGWLSCHGFVKALCSSHGIEETAIFYISYRSLGLYLYPVGVGRRSS